MKRKGWIIVGVVVIVSLLLMLGVGAVALALVGGGGSGNGEWSESIIEGEGLQKVALIRVSGAITSGSSRGGLLSGSSAGSEDLISQLRQAEDDPDVAAIVLRLDTPGGEVVASDDVYREVRRVDKTKPIVASMGGLAASGGYYIAAGARRIVASPATLTGSIGVIMTIPNVAEAANKVGIRPTVITSGPMKDAGSMYREMRPEERDVFQSLINESYEQFLKAISDGRKRPVEDLRSLADGRIYSGTQALANKLVDELGDRTTAYKAALKLAKLDADESKLVEYGADAGLFGGLLGAVRSFGSVGSPVKQLRQELGLGYGLQYLYLP